LRDQRSSYKRADIIVVTKCPPELSEDAKNKIKKEIKPLRSQHIFFTTIEYGEPYHIITKEKRQVTLSDEVLLVCGIANPLPLKKYLLEHAKTYYQQSFSDHHIFTIDDLTDIANKFADIASEQKMIITTEKDAVRLMKFDGQLRNIPVFVLPVKHEFLFNEGMQFDGMVNNFIERFHEEKNKHE